MIGTFPVISGHVAASANVAVTIFFTLNVGVMLGIAVGVIDLLVDSLQGSRGVFDWIRTGVEVEIPLWLCGEAPVPKGVTLLVTCPHAVRRNMTAMETWMNFLFS